MSLETLLEPFRFSFMIRAFLGTGIIAVIAAIVGTFVVLKGLAFMGDAIAHTAFTGSAVALLLGVNLYAGAMAFALMTALGVVTLTRVSRVKNDTALAILFTGFFAVGVIVLSVMPGFAGDLSSLLLGSVMAIQVNEIYIIAVTALIILLMLAFFHGFVMVSLIQWAQNRRLPSGLCTKRTLDQRCRSDCHLHPSRRGCAGSCAPHYSSCRGVLDYEAHHPLDAYGCSHWAVFCRYRPLHILLPGSSARGYCGGSCN